MKFSKLVMSLLSSSGLGLLSLSIFAQEMPAATYPPEAIAVFMQECQTKFAAQAPPGFGDRGDRYCTCLINRLQQKMSYEEFQKMTADNEPPEVKAATNECIGAIF
ncbi:hypothetical protein RHP47_03685 [Thermosynechococcus sp. QKsg1]|uniref:hypothetical protein n=1 Tax=unclassified Thermosynechococcus TaxID=2622553 RepID=UPI0025788044|nr:MULTISPECIES: hypothetical protein [unclassified Thermosynechococcus]WJI24798.1 hypothetical protein MZ909_03695 [Thermosynechococcus sp. B0]WJI27314.1 hypothetical protein M0644_03720 [Thermosynechococcus sp. B1]WJI29846.1 hypothetical protein M0646_03730 [Thermosynechococcus sp. B3]WKT84435.1 hypothetical protein QYC28_03675 [Thermosynechococcus sp. HY596]WNC63568.1 hypothetical protein RHK13_03675 [Thermosynechococcus sp. HY591]